jgi:hypothetical protein
MFEQVVKQLSDRSQDAIKNLDRERIKGKHFRASFAQRGPH